MSWGTGDTIVIEFSYAAVCNLGWKLGAVLRGTVQAGARRGADAEHDGAILQLNVPQHDAAVVEGDIPDDRLLARDHGPLGWGRPKPVPEGGRLPEESSNGTVPPACALATAGEGVPPANTAAHTQQKGVRHDTRRSTRFGHRARHGCFCFDISSFHSQRGLVRYKRRDIGA
jgi:hypothetical protein